MLTHANPCPRRRSTGCKKRVVTQVHATQTAPRSRRPSQSVLVGLHRPAWTRRPWGGLEGAGRCTRRVMDSILHCKRQFTRAARRPQRPTLPRRGARSEARGARSEERGAGSGERGGPGRSGRCAGCVAGSNSERGARSEERGARSGERGAGRPGEEWALRGVCSRFKFALAVPIQTPCSIATSPRSSQATPAGPTLWSPRRLVLRPRPPTRPRPSTRARCVRRAALGRRASNSAPPPSLSRAPTQPEPSISKSSPRDLEFQYPVVVLNIELAKCQVGAPSQSSMTKRSFRHGFEFCTGWCRPSCSTWEF